MAQADRGCYVHKLCEICLNNKLFKCNFTTSLKVSSINASEFLILDFKKNVFRFFWRGPFLKSLLNLSQHCLYFMFCFLGCKAHGILVPQPGIEWAACAPEGEVLTSGPPRSPWTYLSCCFSAAKSCSTLCDPIDCSMPDLPVCHISWSLPKFMSFESVVLSNHLTLCCPRLLLPSSLSHHQSLFQWVGLICTLQQRQSETMQWDEITGKTSAFWWDVKYCSRKTCKNWEHLDKVQWSHFRGNTGVWKPTKLD